MEKENKKVHVTEHTSYHNDEHFQAVESNLPPEQVHKSSKWRKRIKRFMSLSIHLVTMMNIFKQWKVTYLLSRFTKVASGERE